MRKWSTVPLGQLIELVYGAALADEDRSGSGFPVFGSNGIVGYHDQPLITGPGIVVGRKGSVGALAWSNRDFWPIDTTYWVNAGRHLDLRWLYEAMKLCGLQHLSSSTGVPGLNREDAYERLVQVPPAGEQQRIAEILDTIDEAIHVNERIIAKRTAMLSGFVEALVGRTNQITTARRRLGELLQLRMDYRGRTPKKLGMDWGDGQIPALSANNVQMGRIDFGKECYLGSDDLYQRWMTQGDLERGDLLITMEAPLGNIARVPDDRRYILSQRVVLLRFSPAALLNDFAYWYLRSESFQSELQRRSTGTTATGVRRAELERIEIPLIDLPQQKALSDSLSAHEETISREQQVLRKLDETRAGLAADLLSGRVRTVAT